MNSCDHRLWLKSELEATRRNVATAAKSLQSCPTLWNPWTAAYQAPPSMGFSKQDFSYFINKESKAQRMMRSRSTVKWKREWRKVYTSELGKQEHTAHFILLFLNSGSVSLPWHQLVLVDVDNLNPTDSHSEKEKHFLPNALKINELRLKKLTLQKNLW